MPIIKLKRGKEENLPLLQLGEPAFTTDTNKFFIGNGKVNVEMASAAKLDDVVNPLNITFSIEPTTAEIGSVINSVVAKWSYNKDIDSQRLNNETLSKDLRTFTDTSLLKDDKNYTLSVITLGGSAVSKTIKIDFCNGIYYGKSNSSKYDGELIKTLTKVLSDSKARTIAVSSGANEYVFYALPTRLGTPIFSVNGFNGGFSKVANGIDFINTSGYKEKYDIWKSDNANLGTININIK